MTGIKLDYKKHCQLIFGSYVQVHKEPTPTNSPAARTIGAITLGPTGNLKGGYKFLNLQTGKKITRRNWTHLPMPIEVIKRVNQLGKEQNQPTLLTFQDRHGHSTMDPDPYFQPVDVDIEGVIQDPDEQDPNLQDENCDDEHHNKNEDEVKHEQVNLGYPTEAIVENDEPIINQNPILGEIPDKKMKMSEYSLVLQSQGHLMNRP